MLLVLFGLLAPPVAFWAVGIGALVVTIVAGAFVWVAFLVVLLGSVVEGLGESLTKCFGELFLDAGAVGLNGILNDEAHVSFGDWLLLINFHLGGLSGGADEGLFVQFL